MKNTKQLLWFYLRWIKKMASKLEDKAASFYGISPKLAKHYLSLLTPRQAQYLRLIAMGYSCQEIGEMAGVKGGSVWACIGKVIKKTGIKRRRLPALWFAAHFEGRIMVTSSPYSETFQHEP